jgi:hypothetical protein
VQLLKKFPAFYGTKSSLPCSQEPSTGPSPEPDKSNPSHPVSLRSILILPTHLRLGLPSGLLPSGFPTNIVYDYIIKLCWQEAEVIQNHVRSIGQGEARRREYNRLKLGGLSDKAACVA